MEYEDNLKRTFKTSEVIILVTITFVVSVAIGLVIGRVNKNQINVFGASSNHSALSKFEEHYNYILNSYYERLDEEVLINGAIKGMTEVLNDEYSIYITEDEGTNFNVNLEGSYKGLGIEMIKITDPNGILITGLFKDAPAYKAGLQLGDIIIKVDGKDITNMSANEFSVSVLNNTKDTFELTVIREDEELTYTVTKDYVEIESVTSTIYEKNGKKVGYIYLSIFASNTDQQFKSHLEKLEEQNIDSLVIDVRSNTGGHLTAVDNILNIFLTNKQITYQMAKGTKVNKYYGSALQNKKYEIALLGDGNSASASEVLIISLKENLNSKLFGTKTYGKGTVQELRNLENGDQYKITTQKWLTPKGNWINDTGGIEPDEVIEMDEKYFETYEETDDNQLQAAINYLTK